MWIRTNRETQNTRANPSNGRSAPISTTDSKTETLEEPLDRLLQKKIVENEPQMLMSKMVDRAKFSPERLNQYDPREVKSPEDHPGVQITEEQEAIYRSRNELQAKKNPHLKTVLDAPREFFENVEARFEAQKKLNPADPYSFEFGDHGIPVLKDIDSAIAEELELLEAKKKIGSFRLQNSEAAAQVSSAQSGPFSFLRGLGFFKSRKRRDLDVGIKYLAELKADIKSHIDDDSVSYRRLNELAYFSSQALGHFDEADLSFFDRNFLRIDRHLLGRKKNSIQDEYHRYKNNDLNFFQKKAGEPGIETASGMFEPAVFNPEKFELLALPVARSLGPGVFMQLLPHDIYVLGVSPEPEAADGFNRPGGDFYLHDLRHSASIFAKRRVYEMEHNLSREQIKKLEVMQSVWKKEMVKEKKKIKDKELRYAIGFLSFNHHHDRGIPQLPSCFLEDNHGGVADKLYIALTLSKQPIGFKKPKQTLNKAYDWLRDFWLERLPQEKEVLAASY